MKKSLSRSLVGKLFGARTEASKKVKSAKLSLEMLEERQMLSVAPTSVDDSVPVVEAASSSETPPIAFTLTEDATVSNAATSDAIKVSFDNTFESLARNENATIRIVCENTGDVDVAAPLVAFTVKGDDGSQGALLSLDGSYLDRDIQVTATPEGFTNSVQFLAVGSEAGLLKAGEKVAVDVYWAGWNSTTAITENYNLSVGTISVDSTDALPLAEWKAAMKPDSMSDERWESVWNRATSIIGTTWGSYVQATNDLSAYLRSVGSEVIDANTLLSTIFAWASDAYNPASTLATSTDVSISDASFTLSFQRTYDGSSPVLRGYSSNLGAGWDSNWNYSVSLDKEGNATISGAFGASRVFQPTTLPTNAMTYAAVSSTDTGVFVRNEDRSFTLTEQDGTVYNFSADGLLASVVDSNGNKVTATTFAGRVTKLEDARGSWIEIAYNSDGNVAKVSNSIGDSVAYTYDVNGAYLTGAESSNGLKVSYKYDDTGALVETTFADGTTRTYNYDASGYYVDYVDSDGTNATKRVFGDTASTILTYKTYVGTEYQGTTYLNEKGTVAKIVDAAGRENKLLYDDEGRLIGVEGNDASAKIEYDAAGNIVGATDGNGNAVKFEYDENGQATKLIDENGVETSFSYDANGNLTSQTRADGTASTYTYNADRTVATYTTRAGERYEYAYDAKGNVVSVTQSSETNPTQYEYDARGNVVKITESNGDVTTMTYDSNDNLTKIVYANGSFLEYGYDELGRQTSISSGKDYCVKYVYDEFGYLDKVLDGSRSDALLTDYDYDANGLLAKETRGNGSYTVYGYDALGYLTSKVSCTATAETLASFEYTYDGAGNVATMKTLDGTWTYGYDGASQLTSAVFVSVEGGKIADSSYAYTYDAAGNRLTATINGETFEYAYDNMNRLLSDGRFTYTYDANGSLLTKTNVATGEVWTYAWNQDGALVSATSSTGEKYEYEYDAFGNKTAVVHTTTDGETTRTDYLIDPTGDGDVAAELDAEGNIVATYAYGLGLANKTDATGAYYYAYDQLGSTAVVTDENGDVANAYVYDPCGKTISATETVENPFQFVGEYGVASGQNADLISMRARWYDPNSGRFISEDPLGYNAGDFNLYCYCGNDVTISTDPTGEVAQLLITIAAGTLIGAFLGAYFGAAWGDVTILRNALTTPGYYTDGYGNTDWDCLWEDFLTPVKTGTKIGAVLGGTVGGAGLCWLVARGTASTAVAGGTSLGGIRSAITPLIKSLKMIFAEQTKNEVAHNINKLTCTAIPTLLSFLPFFRNDNEAKDVKTYPNKTVTVPLNVTLATDTSGSMSDDMTNVKSDASSIIGLLQAYGNYNVSVVRFCDTYEYLISNSCNSASISSAINRWNTNYGDGGTENTYSMLLGVANRQSLKNNSVNCCIFMTDELGDDRHLYSQVVSAAKRTNTLFFCIYSGSEYFNVHLENSNPIVCSADIVENGSLKELCEATGGEFIVYTSASETTEKILEALESAFKFTNNGIAVYDQTCSKVELKENFEKAEDITQYRWDFDADGNFDLTTNTPEASNVWTTSDVYHVRVEATFNDGTTKTDTMYVDISDSYGKVVPVYAEDDSVAELVACGWEGGDSISVMQGTDGAVVVCVDPITSETVEYQIAGNVSVKGYDGENAFTVDQTANGAVTVYGGAGTDSLKVDASTATEENAYVLSDGIVRSNAGNVVYSNVENVAVVAGSRADSFEVQASSKINYTVDAGAPTEEPGDALLVVSESSNPGTFAVGPNNEKALVWTPAEGDSFQTASFVGFEKYSENAAEKLTAPVISAIYGKKAITASWTANDDASGYLVQASRDANFETVVSEFVGDSEKWNFDELGGFSAYYFRVKALGNEKFVDSDWSTGALVEIPEILNVPEWNLADYNGYTSFKLDATTDDNYTATLYGQEKDGSYTLLKAWDYVGADASATITGDSKVAENLAITTSASKLLGAINFNGGTCSRDTLFIEETDGDDAISIGTEEVVTTTPIYTSNPYEKLLANYEARFGATSKTYLRLKDCYDAAYARLAKMVKTTTSTYGIVDLDGGAKVRFIGVKAITVDAGAGNDSFNVGKLRFNYTLVGGEGADSLDFSNAAASVNVNLGAAYRQAPIAGDCGLMRLDDEFEAVVGSKFNDFVTGGVNGATIDGNGGSDSVVLIGGVNQVALTGKYQSVVIRGAGVYNVALTDADYSNVNAASALADARVQLNATGDHIALYGGLGTVEASVRGDYASINCGATTLTTANVQGDYATVVSGKGADVLGVVGDNATIDSNGGDDQVDVQGGAAVVSLGDGNDVALLADGADGKTGGNYVNGESGDDFIFAANTTGRNYFHAGAGNDVIFGGAGQDYIYATSGVNALFGLGGVDRLYGSGRRDVLAASRPSNWENLETATREELSQLYANLHENWIEKGDLDKTVELLGENSLADGAKDWLFTWRHSDDLVYANQEDVDYVSGVPYGPNWSYLD